MEAQKLTAKDKAIIDSLLSVLGYMVLFSTQEDLFGRDVCEIIKTEPTRINLVEEYYSRIEGVKHEGR